MNKLAAKHKEAAEATYNLNKSTANKIALINAEANELGVLAQIEGLRSEQKSNEVSLSKELVAIKQSDIDATAQLALENKKFNASLNDDNIARLNAEREILLAEQETEKQRLQLKIDSAAIGTQARVDAEIEYKTRMQEIGNEIKQNAKDTSDEEIAIATATKDAKVALQNAQLDNVSAGIGVLKTVFEKNKDIQKGLLIAENAAGIAKIIINTQVGNAKTIAQMGVLPAAPLVLANNIGAGISIAASVAATVKGLQALGGGSASGGSVPSGGGGSAAPQFNVVGATGVNQLAGAIANREQAPIETYVVANNVSTAMALDRNIIRSATLG